MYRQHFETALLHASSICSDPDSTPRLTCSILGQILTNQKLMNQKLMNQKLRFKGAVGIEEKIGGKGELAKVK